MPTRRQFFDLIGTAVAAGTTGLLSGCEDTLRGSFRSAAAVAVPTGARRVASRAALTATPTAFPFQTRDGGEAVYAYTDGDTVIVRSSVCTHKGCAVSWKASTERFACPCHAGYFDRAGLVTGGPPPAPLKTYTVETRGDDLYIEG